MLLSNETVYASSRVTISLREDGAQGQNRTADTRIFSPLLYRLSYLGVGVHYDVLSYDACEFDYADRVRTFRASGD